MELLLRTNFDIPRPHSGSFDPLSYLSLSAASKESSTASRNGSRSPLDQTSSDSPNSESRLPRLDTAASDLINGIAAATESLTPTAVLSLARSILAGSHAVPTRLKILLDRAFDRLSAEEKNIILSACSWNYEDYLRGYKLKDANGVPLDRWTMCTKGEETLLLHQFLAFTETRSITQQLILQDLADRSIVPPSLPTSSSSNISHDDIKDKSELENDSNEVVNIDDATHQPSPKESLLKMVSSHKLYNRQPDMSPPRRPASNASEEGRLRSSSPLSYNARRSVSPISTSSAKENIFSRRLSSGIPLPPSSTMAGIPPLGLPPGFPMFPFHGLPAAVSLPQSSIASHTLQVPSSNADNGALNLSRPTHQEHNRSSLIMDRSSSPADSIKDSPSRRRNSTDSSDKRSQLPEDIGITFVSPSTGKKRVQCNVCMKTFCDKGALKIHFSAVHLREMHKCSVPGCNMMFSSRRSRNRHSANPNPKLHTPTVKRRISQTDGRTHPGPITPIIPKEPSQKPQKENFGSLQNLPAGFPPAGLPFPGLPGFNPFLPPDLKTLQADLQRISDLHKLYNNGAATANSHSPLDLESLKNRAAAMASLSAVMNAANEDGNRKRKSQNPTKRPHLDLGEDMTGVEHVSSDSASDEGFPDPMMDNDDDDIDSISVDDDQN